VDNFDEQQEKQRYPHCVLDLPTDSYRAYSTSQDLNKQVVVSSQDLVGGFQLFNLVAGMQNCGMVTPTKCLTNLGEGEVC